MAHEQTQVTRRGDSHHLADRSSSELKGAVDETRSEMDETINALVARINPGELFSQAMNTLFHGGSKVGREGKQAGRAARDAGSALVEKIRDNPMPAALIAAGAAWLFLSSDDESGEPEDWKSEAFGAKDQSVEAYDVDGRGEAAESGRSLGERASDAASSAVSGAKSAIDTVASGASEAASSAKGGVQRAAKGVGAGGRSVSRSARRGMQLSREGYETAMDEYPLAVGGAALGIGLLCGLMIPETQREHELMGPTRDKMLDEGRTTAEEVVERGKEVVATTVTEAEKTLEEEGLGPRDLKEKLEHTAKHASESGKEEASRQLSEAAS